MLLRGGGSTHGTSEYNIPVRKKCPVVFDDVVTKENLYRAWDDFMRGKRRRADVNDFALRLADNLDSLYSELVSGEYVHGAYEEYMICDPKKRIIHKASVRDRVVHRLIYNTLYPYFDSRFIHDSYSCRKGKGTHKARARFRQFTSQVSKNYTKQCYVLKFDIKKCFASIDTNVLKDILASHIGDKKLRELVCIIINSFAPGLPLGNLTSQLFINIYLHELDIYIKQALGVPYYIRYADDVVIVGNSREDLRKCMDNITTFIRNELRLKVHKIQFLSMYTGVDVVGEIFFPKYTTLRRSTARKRSKSGV